MNATVPLYHRLNDRASDDLGLLEHPAPNLEPGDLVLIPDGREALVTARICLDLHGRRVDDAVVQRGGRVKVLEGALLGLP